MGFVIYSKVTERKKLINIAILGCGRIAQHHCDAIKATEGLRLAAVCDQVEDISKKTGEKYSVPSFAKFSEMAQEIEFDTVAIITPSGIHYDHASIILKHYSKNIIVEKPTVLKKSQFNELFSVAKNANKKIFPIFQNRKNLAVQRVLKGVTESELGDLQSVSVRVRWCRENSYYNLAKWRGTFAMDGGALTNQGVHHLDLLRLFFGEPKNVFGRARTFGSDIEVEDTFIGLCEFSDNKIGSIEVTTAARPKDFCAEISIVGSKGLAQIGGIAVNELQIYTPAPQECEKFSEDFSGNIYGKGHASLYSEIESSLRNIDKELEFSITMDDAFGTISFLDSCYRAIESNAMVSVFSEEESKNLGKINKELSKFYELT